MSGSIVPRLRLAVPPTTEGLTPRRSDPHLRDVLACVRPDTTPRQLESSRELLEGLLAFQAANDNPQLSTNFAAEGEADPVERLTALLPEGADTASTPLTVPVLAALRIVSRKQVNRAVFDAAAITRIVRLLHCDDAAAAAQAASVVLNVCYDNDKTALVVDAGAVTPLVAMLYDRALGVRSAAAGALQSLCFRTKAKETVVRLGGLAPLLSLLPDSTSAADNASPAQAQCLTRAIGALHNISTHPKAIPHLRQERRCIASVTRLLSCRIPGVATSAAGLLQNMAREETSRKLIQQANAVQPLLALLVNGQVPAQVCAVGALLNILGPELDDDVLSDTRIGLRTLLSSTLTLAMTHAALTEGAAVCLDEVLKQHAPRGSGS